MAATRISLTQAINTVAPANTSNALLFGQSEDCCPSLATLGSPANRFLWVTSEYSRNNP
ncbi:hypothetical protein D3C80_2135330 [compost metagenome]